MAKEMMGVTNTVPILMARHHLVAAQARNRQAHRMLKPHGVLADN
jgi:hypothetical protein